MSPGILSPLVCLLMLAPLAGGCAAVADAPKPRAPAPVPAPIVERTFDNPILPGHVPGSQHLPRRRRLLPGHEQLRIFPRRADLPQPRSGALAAARPRAHARAAARSDRRGQLGRHLRAHAAPSRGPLLHDHDAGRLAEPRRKLLRHRGGSARAVVGSDLAGQRGLRPVAAVRGRRGVLPARRQGRRQRSSPRLPGAHRSGDGRAARADAGRSGRGRAASGRRARTSTS